MGATQRTGFVVCRRNLRGHRHTNAHGNTKADGNSYSDSEADCDTNGYTKTDRNADGHRYGNAETNCDTDRNTETHGNAYGHCYGNSKADCYPNCDGYGNAERKLRASLGSGSYLRYRSDGQLSGHQLQVHQRTYIASRLGAAERAVIVAVHRSLQRQRIYTNADA